MLPFILHALLFGTMSIWGPRRRDATPNVSSSCIEVSILSGHYEIQHDTVCTATQTAAIRLEIHCWEDPCVTVRREAQEELEDEGESIDQKLEV